jgi:hypothetical protein
MADVQIAVIDQQNTEVTVAVPGVQGPVGEGVPSGGTANQVLFKQSGTDYDTAWSEITSEMIGDLEIVNADIAADAEIAVSKLAIDAVVAIKAQNEEIEIRRNCAFSVGAPGAVPYGVGPAIPPGMAFFGIGPDAYNPVHLPSGSFC